MLASTITVIHHRRSWSNEWNGKTIDLHVHMHRFAQQNARVVINGSGWQQSCQLRDHHSYDLKMRCLALGWLPRGWSMMTVPPSATLSTAAVTSAVEMGWLEPRKWCEKSSFLSSPIPLFSLFLCVSAKIINQGASGRKASVAVN